MSGGAVMIAPRAAGPEGPRSATVRSRTTRGETMNEPTQQHLSAEQLAQIREELVRTRERLDRSLKATRRANQPVVLDQTSVGRLSRIDALQNQGLTKGLEEREMARRAQIENALRRVDDGTYGRCSGCGKPIAFERLLVFPEALACGACGGGV